MDLRIINAIRTWGLTALYCEATAPHHAAGNAGDDYVMPEIGKKMRNFDENQAILF